jgi:benzoylformate decarboxylase
MPSNKKSDGADAFSAAWRLEGARTTQPSTPRREQESPMADAPSTKRTASGAARTVTVREATIHLLRGWGCTTMFGNPGSTELPLFKDWPEDFRYVLGLQEATVVGMADAYALGTRNAAIVNLHSAAGTGHALGNLFGSWKNNSPVVVIAGQQARSMLLMEPFLGAQDAAEFPKPYVKYSVEPARAEDVPAAIARAYYTAMQEPRGPVFVSVPVDDWDKACELIEPRQVVSRKRPDARGLTLIADALAGAKNPCMVVGADVDRSGAFDLTVKLAERYETPVWVAPRTYRCNFPESHRLFAGFLPISKADVAATLKGHDVILALGAPVFTYHAESNGQVVPSGSTLYQIVNDEAQAAFTSVGTTVVASVDAAVEDLLALPAPRVTRQGKGRGPRPVLEPTAPMTPAYVMQRVGKLRPKDSIVVEEAPTARGPMSEFLPIDKADGFFTTGSGGLGYGMPAAVGMALARPDQRIVAIIGDGSSMYSVQALWTAAQLKLPISFLIINNGGYLALKQMAGLFQMTEVIGTDLPGIDFVGLAGALGISSTRVDGAQGLDKALKATFASDGPRLVDITVEASFADKL